MLIDCRSALPALQASKARVLAAAGMETTISTPVEFGAYIKAEIEKWTAVASASNIKLD